MRVLPRILFVLFALIVAWCSYAAWVTWRTSRTRVEARLAKLTPLGMPQDEVLALLLRINKQHPQERLDCPGEEASFDEKRVQAFDAVVEEYGLFPLPLIRYAYATWCFDERHLLRRVVVASGLEGP